MISEACIVADEKVLVPTFAAPPAFEGFKKCNRNFAAWLLHPVPAALTAHPIAATISG